MVKENQISIVNAEREISLFKNKEDIMALFVKRLFEIKIKLVK